MKSVLPVDGCDIAFAQSLVGGKWKVVILWKLLEKRMRLSELRRTLPGISEAVLIAQLKDLERARLVSRIDFGTVPPHVEYEVTEAALLLRPALLELERWGRAQRLNSSS